MVRWAQQEDSVFLESLVAKGADWIAASCALKAAGFARTSAQVQANIKHWKPGY